MVSEWFVIYKRDSEMHLFVPVFLLSSLEIKQNKAGVGAVDFFHLP